MPEVTQRSTAASYQLSCRLQSWPPFASQPGTVSIPRFEYVALSSVAESLSPSEIVPPAEKLHKHLNREISPLNWEVPWDETQPHTTIRAIDRCEVKQRGGAGEAQIICSALLMPKKRQQRFRESQELELAAVTRFACQRWRIAISSTTVVSQLQPAPVVRTQPQSDWSWLYWKDKPWAMISGCWAAEWCGCRVFWQQCAAQQSPPSRTAFRLLHPDWLAWCAGLPAVCRSAPRARTSLFSTASNKAWRQTQTQRRLSDVHNTERYWEIGARSLSKETS